MSLTDLKLKSDYHSLVDNVIEDFYIPCLEQSSLYKRITGFFSGMSFQLFGRGLSRLVTNGGHMKLLISTRLSKEEEEAISKGYSEREIVEKNFLASIKDPQDEFEKGYLSLLTYLIKNDILDIRVVVIDNGYEHAMEHQKIGIFTDEAGNVVATQGSSNLTPQGLMINGESFDVYCSWLGTDPYLRCFNKEASFNAYWDNAMPKMRVIPFPQAVKEKLFSYSENLSKEQLATIDDKYVRNSRLKEAMKIRNKIPQFEENKYRPYQLEAINSFAENKYRGYFDMATGTGKTLTALGALTKLIKEKYEHQENLLILIVVPSQFLVKQRDEECKNYNIRSLLAYGNSKEWKENFKQKVISIKLNQSNFESIIMTTNSLLHDFVIDAINDKKVLDRTIIISDEAHNLGASKSKMVLNMDFKYRLGLSATIERHFDKQGTEQLLGFFEKCCIKYDLGKAIAEGYLSHYRYYPILVNFDEDELDKYISLSKQISKISKYKDEDEENEGLKRLLLKRALLVAGCKMKFSALVDCITPFKSNYYNLIYCGAVSYENSKNSDEYTQVKQVQKILTNDVGMIVEQFTAEEDMKERQAIREHFENKFINGIVAIKCLDEGVNIPCIQRAFILASTTNSKEYIQRRGRVLRLFDPKEKPYAEIYDFITLSRPLENMITVNEEYVKYEASLAKRELKRMEEFASLSDNSSDSYLLMQKIKDAYGLNKFVFDEEGDYEE